MKKCYISGTKTYWGPAGNPEQVRREREIRGIEEELEMKEGRATQKEGLVTEQKEGRRFVDKGEGEELH